MRGWKISSRRMDFERTCTAHIRRWETSFLFDVPRWWHLRELRFQIIEASLVEYNVCWVLMCLEGIIKIVYCSTLALLLSPEWRIHGFPIPPDLFLETWNLWFNTLQECAGAILLFKIIHQVLGKQEKCSFDWWRWSLEHNNALIYSIL